MPYICSMLTSRYLALAAACLLLGALLRCAGLTRASSDFVPPGVEGARGVYGFHPDEQTLLRAALELENLLDPPLTAYGTLPMLLGRLALYLSFGLLHEGGPNLESTEARSLALHAVRLLSALSSCALLGLLLGPARRFFGPEAGLWAACFVGAVPLAVQQAHFYTVDGLFALLVLAAFLAGLQAFASGRRSAFALAGALAGAAAATRLNGLLLAALLGAGHLLWEGRGRVGARLRQKEAWYGVLAGLGLLVLLQPYLVLRPGLLLRAQSTDDFLYSLQVARGDILAPWSLVDVHTPAYLHYWTHLWPQAVGWPLTLALVAGAAHGLWRRQRVQVLALVWCGLYYASIGGLHTKHVRYLLPMLPFLALLAGGLCVAVRGRWRRAGAVFAAALAAYTALYGVAFARIYTVEDSRLQAARWIAEHVPRGAHVGVERGGFTMAGLLGESAYRRLYLDTGRLFATRGYLSCGATRRFLEEGLREMEWLVLIDVNRYRQYVAAPELYPVVADFYARLVEGELGFARVKSFRVHPGLPGVEFADEGAEPSFYGFDHPAVWVFRREEHLAAVLERWEAELGGDPRCPDRALEEAARALRAFEAEAALQALEPLRGWPLAALVEGAAQRRLGRQQEAEQAFSRYLRGYEDASLAAQLIPWAAAASLLEAGVEELALEALVDGADKAGYMSAGQRQILADTYGEVAAGLLAKGEQALAGEVYRLAALVEARPETCNRLAALAYEQGRRREALSWWETSLALDSTQVQVLRLAGRVAYEEGAAVRALGFLERAVDLDGRLTRAQRAADYAALAVTAREVGHPALAARLWERALEAEPGRREEWQPLIEAARQKR